MDTATPQTIEDYIAQFDDDRQVMLNEVYAAIREAAPEALERISYGIPTFWQGHNLIHFAAAKNHLGLYPGKDGVEAFAEKLAEAGYRTSTGTIRFPFDQPLPLDLIAEITRFRAQEETHRR